ncbi:hypothetical protein ACFL43_00780 [Thermodesulfobacteriota bacterium]
MQSTALKEIKEIPAAQSDITAEVCEPDPLTEDEKAALLPCLDARGLQPAMLDIMTGIRDRTRIVKVRSRDGALLGLTSVLRGPSIFMKHCFGHGNHIGTNSTFFFTGTHNKAGVLSAIFKKFTEMQSFGFYIGFIDEDMAADFRDALSDVPHVVADRVMETGAIDTGEPDTLQALLKKHKHLSRQVNRFKNNGGTVHIHEGPVEDSLADAFVSCCVHSYRRNSHPGRPIDVERYGAHVRNFLTTFPATVHIYARLSGTVVGVQSFIRHTRHLELTEGGFLTHTCHAYENIIAASAQYGLEQNLERVSYGLILNGPKNRLMDKANRKPVFLVMFFQEPPDEAAAQDYRRHAHERFPQLLWRPRSAFEHLPI